MLKVGQIIKLQRGLHKVLDVNENRAIVKPLDKCKRDFTTRFGKKVKFESYQQSFAISAESDCVIYQNPVTSTQHPAAIIQHPANV